MERNQETSKKVCVAFLSFCLCLICCQAAGDKTDRLTASLQQELDRLALYEEIPGVTLSVRLANQPEICLASGFADLENKIAMKPGDIMFSGSIGKNFVAALALKLLGKQKIDPDALVSPFFKQAKWFSRLPNAQSLTIRMLLNHTSGLPGYENNPKVWTDLKKNPDKVFSGKDRLEYIFDAPAMHPPGAGWYYSDTNYIVVGMLIEKITNRAFYDLVMDDIIRPLGLNFTTPADKRRLAGLIPGYAHPKEAFIFEGKMLKQGQFVFNPQLEWTGGGWVTNSSDLSRWTKLLYEGAYLSQQEIAMMTSPGDQKTDIPNGKYGFATIIWEKEGLLIYGHTGYMPGYRSIVQYIPKWKMALALQINTDKGPADFSMDDSLDPILKILIKERAL